MLLEEEKNRIRMEEIFRHEIRSEIEAGKPRHSRRKRLWSLLNSSFALWFLSSIVLGGLTAAVTMYQRSSSEQMRKDETQRRLNTEISSRITEGLVALRLDQKRINNGQTFYISAMYNEAIFYLNNHVTDDHGVQIDWSIYPEYQQRSFRSLIFELSSVVERSMLPALREAVTAHEQLVDLSDQVSLGEDYSKPPAPDKSILLDANRKAADILDRLQTNPFWRAELRFQPPARKGLFNHGGR